MGGVEWALGEHLTWDVSQCQPKGGTHYFLLSLSPRDVSDSRPTNHPDSTRYGAYHSTFYRISGRHFRSIWVLVKICPSSIIATLKEMSISQGPSLDFYWQLGLPGRTTRSLSPQVNLHELVQYQVPIKLLAQIARTELSTGMILTKSHRTAVLIGSVVGLRNFILYTVALIFVVLNRR